MLTKYNILLAFYVKEQHKVAHKCEVKGKLYLIFRFLCKEAAASYCNSHTLTIPFMLALMFYRAVMKLFIPGH